MAVDRVARAVAGALAGAGRAIMAVWRDRLSPAVRRATRIVVTAAAVAVVVPYRLAKSAAASIREMLARPLPAPLRRLVAAVREAAGDLRVALRQARTDLGAALHDANVRIRGSIGDARDRVRRLTAGSAPPPAPVRQATWRPERARSKTRGRFAQAHQVPGVGAGRTGLEAPEAREASAEPEAAPESHREAVGAAVSDVPQPAAAERVR